jgi:SAM-dependent methyltransferase
VTFVAVIEHLIDPYHILAEIKRVLKTNGVFVLIIGAPNVASFSNRIRILTGHRPRTSFDMGWDGGHLLYFTPRDLKGLLAQYGFGVVEKYATGNLQFLRKLFFNLTGEFIFKCKLRKKQ